MSSTATENGRGAERTSKARSATRRSGRGPLSTLGAAGDRINRAARAGARHVSENPLTAVAGAAAVSAGLALLLPAGRREAEVMGELAEKVSDVARGAAENVVEIGRSEVETLAQGALADMGGAVIEALVSGEATKMRPSS